jgi:hypothetical protein
MSVALSLPVFAQAEREVKTGGKDKETTLKLMLNGGLDVAFAYDSEQLRETGHWINGGVDGENADPYYYFNGPAWLSFAASLQDNVELVIVIRNVPFNQDESDQDPALAGANTNITSRTNWGDNFNVTIKYAYMRIKELFDPAWSLSVGQMDVIWDIRGKGNAVFLDVAHAESPWSDVSRAWAHSVRSEEFPVGFKVAYARDQFNFELGLFPVIRDAQAAAGVVNQSRQQAIYYLSGVFGVDNQGSKIGGIFALFHGINPQDNVYTIGLGGLWVPQKDIEVFLEGYAQFGNAWTDSVPGSGGRAPLGGTPAAFAEDGEHSAFMFLIGGRLDVPGETAAFIELHFLWVTGHDMDGGASFSNANGFALGNASNDESREFMSYENYDVMLLLNSNEWGYDFDTNILQITVQGGVMMSTGGAMKNNLHFILKLAYGVAPQEWEVAAVPGIHAADDPTGYGFEIDLVARWFLNKNANIYWSFGYLAGSEILENFNREEDSFAWIWLLGVQVSN